MTDSPPAHDRFRWAILALVSVSHVIGAGAQYGINTLAPFYQDELGLSRAQVGLFFSGFYLAMTGASFGAGWLADRWGVRRTTLQGHVFVGLCTAAAAFAPSFTWALASFFFAGLGYSFLNPASTKGVMVWFHRDERATAMGIKQTGVPAGGFVTALIAPPLVLLIGWRGALALTGRTSFADRATAIADYHRAVGVESLVTGLEASKGRLVKRLLADRRVTVYPGGRDDLAAGRVDVRIVALLSYLAERHGSVTVSSLFSGHRKYARPGVVSAHVYGQAVDIASIGGASIAGHQQPGGITEAAVRSILLLPAELQPQQVISLLGLGGPSFPLADHGDHIHVGY